MSEMNIYQRISAITNDLTVVAKNLEIDVGGGKSYKAVSEGDVLAAVKPLEQKYGVCSYPVRRDTVKLDRDFVEKETKYNGEVRKNISAFVRVETVYRFVNLDDPTDYAETTSYGDGVDSQDKAPGKACTYCDKYALLKMYKIITGDDIDPYASGAMYDAVISAEHASALEKDLSDTNTDYDKFCEAYGVLKVSQLTLSQFADAATVLSKRRQRQERAAPKDDKAGAVKTDTLF